jgi:hypothetical protein
MGWWKIDPETGVPATDGRSKLSNPPDFVLLNAVPGVDDESEAHYLGDGPWDMAYSTAQDMKKLFPGIERLSEQVLTTLLMDGLIPPALAGAGTQTVDDVLQAVQQFWDEIDWCYRESWERPARAAERRWVCKEFLEEVTKFKAP